MSDQIKFIAGGSMKIDVSCDEEVYIERFIMSFIRETKV